MEENTSITVKRRTGLEKIIFGILLAVTFLIPLFFVPTSFMPMQFGTSLLFALGVIVAIILYIIDGLLSGSLHLPKPSKYILGFMALPPLVYFLAGIANGFSRLTFFGYTFDIATVGFILLGFAYLFLVSVIFRTKQRIFYSYLAFDISAIILALFLLARIVFGAGFLSFGIFTDLTSSVIGSWNNVGIFFGITAITSLLSFHMVRTSKVVKALFSLGLLLSLFFLALVNFSVIWIILGLTAFLFILYSVFAAHSVYDASSPRNKLRKVPVYAVIVLVVSIVFTIWGGSLGSFLSSKLNVTNVEVRPTLAVTLNIAQNTIRYRPLFGSGPNTFVNQWLTFKPNDIVTTIFWNTDFSSGIGLIPTFAVTIGLIGVLSWLLFLGFFIYLGIKSIFARVEDGFLKYLVVSSFFVSLYLWIMTFAYVPSVVILVLTFFFTGLFFASVFAAGIVPVELKVFSHTPRAGFLASLLMVGFFVGSIALGWGLLKTTESLYYFQKSSYALNTANDITSSETYMNKAIGAVPEDIYYRSLSQIELAKLNAVASQDSSKVPAATIQKQFSDTLTSAITAAIAAKDADPNNYQNWISLGDVYAAVSNPQLNIQGAYQSAVYAYQQALVLNPQNPSIYVLLGQAAEAATDLTSAKAYAQEAVQMKQDYTDGYFLLAQVEVDQKDLAGAIQSTTQASVIDPTNSGTFFQLGLLKYNNGDYTGAITALLQAIKLTPNYANAQYFLGLSYDATGQRDLALALFNQLLTTNPGNAQIEAILTNLNAGRPALANAPVANPTKAKTPPLTEKQ